MKLKIPKALRRNKKKRRRGYWDGMPEEFIRAEYQKEWKAMTWNGRRDLY